MFTEFILFSTILPFSEIFLCTPLITNIHFLKLGAPNEQDKGHGYPGGGTGIDEWKATFCAC